MPDIFQKNRWWIKPADKQANKIFRVFRKNRFFQKNPVFLKSLYPKIYGTLLKNAPLPQEGVQNQRI